MRILATARAMSDSTPMRQFLQGEAWQDKYDAGKTPRSVLANFGYSEKVILLTPHSARCVTLSCVSQFWIFEKYFVKSTYGP